MRKGILLVLMIASAFFAKAQQDAQYSMYIFNGLYLNPAYAGSKDVMSLTGIYRYQWVGVDGAPQSASVSLHSPFKKDQYAMGGILSFDQIGVTRLYTANISYAYRLKLNDNLKLSLGVQAGASMYETDFQEVVKPDPTASDPSFTLEQDVFLPNFGVGAYLYSKRFFIGVSAPHLLTNTLEQKLTIAGASDDVARQYNHYMATAGVVFGDEDARLKFKPSVLLKYVANAPVDYDVNLGLLFNDRFWLAASYRGGGNVSNQIGESVVGMFEVLVTQQFRLGYAYDYTLSDLQDHTSGSHEIMLGYDFGFEDKRFANPRYMTYF